MPGPATPFVVSNRFRITWEGLWLTLACVVFTGIGVALVLRGSPVDLALGLLAVAVFGGAGLVSLSRFLSHRPVLILDEAGVHFIAPWPRGRRDDLSFPWSEVALLRACTQVVPHRGGSVPMHYLVFVNRDEAELPFHPPSPWHTTNAVRVRPTWNHTIGEIIEAAHHYKPDLPFDDRRRPGPGRG
ncbi:STM3941 family protein [Streptomonospora nanhaiensis]|uniref:Uncharacterized protein n=1 Tax=Streptomonospora nanhaiensis TaxID=1323731 RepID=A0A853BGX8_9ACTN|nr:STM3941 family protein [Streptomonospora nanhaiensis]MBV2366152.1 hypothetical protein [Streptomonospora nanhaiensis]MBX9391015.1 hypothetical protein [Streptomonospora nanhaiensis]NYI93871.1 hypothetical protein [Streptomonospora nanhaiensis]